MNRILHLDGRRVAFLFQEQIDRRDLAADLSPGAAIGAMDVNAALFEQAKRNVDRSTTV